jgi:GT2 family glycosyltransferase/glycosyltransferase involved in cell wall biosynthesis
MDSEKHELSVDSSAPPRQRILIAIPFYKNEHLVELVVGSLIRCASDLSAIGAEVVLYDDSPFYPALRRALEAILPAAQAAFPCRAVFNAENLGFVRTMNLAVDDAVRHRAHLLLLNSDTEVEPGALPEMTRLLALDHMIGFVNPRSDNATIATLPLRAVPADRAGALAAYRALARLLPPVSYIPTAVGFCMLINWRVLAEFGGFDTAYGKGYNEENDLVMRASRCGFRAVMANHAFVWHAGEESFSVATVDRTQLEPENRALLDARYPEYGGHTLNYYFSPENVAQELLAATLPDADGKLDMALDFSSFRCAQNGTFMAGWQLLEAATRVWNRKYNLHVLCGEDVYDFHGYEKLGVPRAEPHGGKRFAAVFRVGQPYDWNVLERLVVSGAVIGVYMLDTISIDCPQLTSPFLYNMWQFTLDHIDLLATQSHQTEAQFEARFELPPHTRKVVSLHSLDIADYRLPVAEAAAPQAPRTRERVLILGNHFHHKYISRTANALAAAFKDRDIVALGLERPKKTKAPDAMEIAPLIDAPNLTGVAVGKLTDAEMGAHFAGCDLVVFPSHAEGFGFPVLNALAAGRPVMLRRLPVFEELWRELGHTPNIHFYDSTDELLLKLRELPRWQAWDAPPPGNGTERSAREIEQALEAALADADYGRIVRRLRAVQLAAALNHPAHPSIPDTKAAKAAHFAAERFERVLRRVLSFGLFYHASRIAFKAVRVFRPSR